MFVESHVFASNFGSVSVIPVLVKDPSDVRGIPIRVSSIYAKIENDKSITVEIKSPNEASDAVVRDQINTAVKTAKSNGLNFTHTANSKSNPSSTTTLTFNDIRLSQVCQILASTFVDKDIAERFVEAGIASTSRMGDISIGGALPFLSTREWEENLNTIRKPNGRGRN